MVELAIDNRCTFDQEKNMFFDKEIGEFISKEDYLKMVKTQEYQNSIPSYQIYANKSNSWYFEEA